MPFTYKPLKTQNLLVIREFLANLVKETVDFHSIQANSQSLFQDISFQVEGSTYNLADNLETKSIKIYLTLDLFDAESDVIDRNPGNNTGQFRQKAKLNISCEFSTDLISKMDNLTYLLISSLCHNKSAYEKVVFGENFISLLSLNELKSIVDNSDYSSFFQRSVSILFKVAKK